MRLSPLAAHLAPLALPPSTVHQDHHGHYHPDHHGYDDHNHYGYDYHDHHGFPHQDHQGHYYHDHCDNRNQRTLLEKKIEKKSLICIYVLVMTVTTVQVFSPVEGTTVSR